MKDHYLRIFLVGVLVAMAVSFAAKFSQARPPRPRRAPAARHHRARAARPRPARIHSGRVKPGAKRALHRKRISTYRPVVVGGYYPSGGVVVIKESGTSTESANGETTKTDVSAQPESEATKYNQPSDADKGFAGQPAYRILRVEDDGMTAVVKVDGQETKVRLIGIAAMAQGQDSNRRDQTGHRRPSVTGHFMENMLKGEKVYIVYDSQVEETDEDGKYVAYIYRDPDGLLVNLEAIRQGFGVADTSYDFDEKETFQYYNDKARQLGKGVWGRRKNRPGRNGGPGAGLGPKPGAAGQGQPVFPRPRNDEK